jgi:phage terminase large subunit-like protein
MLNEFTASAMRYANGVAAGSILAPKTIIDACIRTVADHARDTSDSWPYEFRDDAAGMVCAFIESLPHTEGVWASRGENIILQPWQRWIICEIFGWHTLQGNRRFRTAYIEVPRKNGKSLLGASIGLYMLLCDGEPGAQIFSAATSREQSKIVFDTAMRIVKRAPGMLSAYGMKLLQHSITVPSTHGVFRALASEDRGSISLDGLNVHCAIVDELHAHSNPGTWNALESATGARANSLIFAITTAGNDRTNVCYQVREYARKVAGSVTEDPSFFSAIWGLDDDAADDSWKSPTTWRLCNPNTDTSVSLDDLARQCRKAEVEPSFESNFKTKRLCVWIHADKNLFNVRNLFDAADDTMTREQFRGQQCYVAIDLAPLHDFTAVVYLFTLEGGAYYALADHYLPQSEVDANPQFVTWHAQGLIKTVPGNRMNYGAVIDDVISARDEWGLDVACVAFDPWQANELATALDDARFEIVSIPMRVSHLSEPTKKLESLIVEGKLVTSSRENAPLAWCISNVVGHFDRKDNVYPTRPDDHRLKIDSALALILALSRAMVVGGNTSVYDTPGEPIWIGGDDV